MIMSIKRYYFRLLYANLSYFTTVKKYLSYSSIPKVFYINITYNYLKILEYTYKCFIINDGGIPMLQEMRLQKIKNLLEEKGELTTIELCDILDVSRDTVRRDIVKLVDRQEVRRIHGGIMLLRKESGILDFEQRLLYLAPEKKKIALLAEGYIHDHDICFFDVSTTILMLAKNISKEVIIYTHSLDNAMALSNKTKLQFHLIGGKFHLQNRFFFSHNETELLQNINFDVCFIGAAAIMEDGLYYKNQEDAYIKSLAIKHSKKVILLTESEKFDKVSTYKGVSFKDINIVITDTMLPEEKQALFPSNTIFKTKSGGNSNG